MKGKIVEIMELLRGNTTCMELRELGHQTDELGLLKLYNPEFYSDLSELRSLLGDHKVCFLDFHRLRIVPVDSSRNELWVTLAGDSDYWCNGRRVRNLKDAFSF